MTPPILLPVGHRSCNFRFRWAGNNRSYLARRRWLDKHLSVVFCCVAWLATMIRTHGTRSMLTKMMMMTTKLDLFLFIIFLYVASTTVAASQGDQRSRRPSWRDRSRPLAIPVLWSSAQQLYRWIKFGCFGDQWQNQWSFVWQLIVQPLFGVKTYKKGCQLSRTASIRTISVRTNNVRRRSWLCL